jgi:hypothetical protein
MRERTWVFTSGRVEIICNALYASDAKIVFDLIEVPFPCPNNVNHPSPAAVRG